MPATSSRMPDSGPVWYIGPTTRWVPNAANRFSFNASRCSAIVGPPANIEGGSSVPFGRPVVPDVYSRLGRGTTSSGGSSAGPPATHVAQSVTSPRPLQRQPITVGRRPVASSAIATAASARSTVSGPTNTIALAESIRMYAASSAVRWKLTGTVEVEPSRPPEMRQRRLDRVLGEHRHSPLVAQAGVQFGGQQPIGHPVEGVAHRRPAERDPLVPDRHLLGSVRGQPPRELRHRRPWRRGLPRCS